MDFERTTIIGMGADAAFARLADPLLVAQYVPLVAHAGSDAEEGVPRGGRGRRARGPGRDPVPPRRRRTPPGVGRAGRRLLGLDDDRRRHGQHVPAHDPPPHPRRRRPRRRSRRSWRRPHATCGGCCPRAEPEGARPGDPGAGRTRMLRRHAAPRGSPRSVACRGARGRGHLRPPPRRSSWRPAGSRSTRPSPGVVQGLGRSRSACGRRSRTSAAARCWSRVGTALGLAGAGHGAPPARA